MRIPGTIDTNPFRFVVGFRFLVVTLVLASAGNIDGSPEIATQSPEPVGQYLLVSANGQELPAVVSESGAVRQEVVGGSILLEADGGFSWSTRYRYTDRGVVEVSESSGRGTYLHEGTRIVARFEVGADGCCEGTLDGNTLTIQADVSMVYRKVFSQRPAPGVTAADQLGVLAPPPGPPQDTVTIALPLSYLSPVD